MDFDLMSDAELARRVEVITLILERDSPEVIEAFLASPEIAARGLAWVAGLRRTFDSVRDWQQSECHAFADELARRRREAASSAPRQEVTTGLYFGPWRGFSPLA